MPASINAGPLTLLLDQRDGVDVGINVSGPGRWGGYGHINVSGKVCCTLLAGPGWVGV